MHMDKDTTNPFWI